jgi:hypothetical protein
VGLVAWALFAAAPAFAALPSETFARANRAYAEQKYDAAISAYEELLRTGIENDELYYNLGNAYFRAGKLGPAVLSFERALRLAPRFEDARYNLEVARELAGVRFGKDTLKGVSEDPWWVRAANWLTLSELVWAFLALDLLFFAVLVVARFLSDGFLRTGLVVGDVFAGLSGVLVGALLFGHIYFLDHVRSSIVVTNEVTMREGPDPTRREMPKLHAGHRVVWLRESNGWVRIRLANRVEGWVPRASVEEI